MPAILQISFPYQGPFGAAMAQALAEFAESIAREPGLLGKIWTENEGAREAGGVYLFGDEQAARAYLAKHTARLRSLGISDIRAAVFAVNDELSRITRGPLGC
jgi:hypothetical protein